MKKIAVIVSNVPHDMHLVESAPLHHLVRRALHEAGVYSAYGAYSDWWRDSWELRTEDGVLLDTSLTVLDLGFACERLYLNRSAGVGG